MNLVRDPSQFDVMVTPNLYGNLVRRSPRTRTWPSPLSCPDPLQLSNVAAGLCGGSGIAPGANIGNGLAIFEQGARAVDKQLSGKGIANPTAFMLSSAMMLRHMGLHGFAERLREAVHTTLASGKKEVLTPDLGGHGRTMDFALEVMKNC